MYWHDGRILVSSDGEPDLATTQAFDSLLDTLPDDCPIPTPMVKFGLLTQHVRPISDDFVVKLDEDDIISAETATVPRETLRAVEHLLYHYTNDLSKNKKKEIGRFCEVTQLDRANKLGASESAVREAVAEEGDKSYSFLVQTGYSCRYCAKEFDSENTWSDHLANCDENRDREKSDADQSPQKSSSKKRPAFGKEIKQYRGRKRLTGRNPFADPERVKDTGLHQGGGS